jgi:chromosome segregation ATPase
MTTATKLLKMKKKEARKIRAELGGVLIVIERLEKRRLKLDINPDLNAALVSWQESLRERVEALKAVAERVEGLTEADIACPE